jgi:predicted Rossmann fold nucleotide-binding protein DprA/Smf involved in DNA uptake
MEFVACIGSRAINAEEQHLCYRIGQFLSQNYNIKTGNALGADQAYAKVLIQLTLLSYTYICLGRNTIIMLL